MRQLKPTMSTKQEGLKRSRENAHNTCARDTPTEVEFNLVNRVMVTRNSGSSDPSPVLTIPGMFRGFTRRRGVWVTRSVGTISSASLSMNDTGTPEFVNRIYIPWLV